jgi:hypothetical protein
VPHVIERASSGRATCRGCGGRIVAGEWRFGERLPNPFDEHGGDMTHWFHVPCAAYRRPEPFLDTLGTTAEPIENREAIARAAALGAAHHRVPRVGTAERATSGRATCRACRTTIDKGAWRIALVFYEDGRFSPSGFIHVRCAPVYLETSDIMPRLRHFSPALTTADLDEIQAELAAG